MARTLLLPRFNSILNRYIFLELWPPFVLNLLFFAFIFLISRLLDIMRLIVNYRVSPLTFLLLLLYSMPFFMEFVIPMSVMMAVLLTMLRMSADNEIVALKSSGISPNRFMPAVVLFCLIGWAMTSFISFVGLPWGNRSYAETAVGLARSHIQAAIKERTFIDGFEGVVLYINKIDMRDHRLVDVFIQDQRTQGMQSTIVAPRGELTTLPEEMMVYMKLYNGTINRVDLQNHTASSISFRTYEMKLDLKEMMARGADKPKAHEQMTIGELRKLIDTTPRSDPLHYQALLKYHERFSLPFACLALGILAVPLGIESRRGKRSMGIIIGIALFLMYYLMLSVGRSLGESGEYPPAAGMWAPNAVMGMLGLFLYYRTLRDRELPVGWLARIFNRRRWFGRRRHIRA